MRSTVGNVGSNSARPQSGFRRRIGIGAFVSAAIIAASAQTALAGAEFKLSDDATLNLGLGLRTSFTSLEKGAANGSSTSNDFSAESTRVYMSGAFGSYIKATMNFDRQGGASATATTQMIDGIAQFEVSEGFNVWMGRMLPPSDRANLYGPYYTSAWAYPGIASNGPSVAAGRDDGGMIWGSLMDSKLAYSVGLFNGHNRGTTNSNNTNKLMTAARLQYSFWDAEKGYYRNATYLGGKDVLSIGGSIQQQSNGTGTAAKPGELKISNIDFLMDGVVDGAARKGEALMAKFRELQKTQPLIGDVRGKGLMVGVELIADPATKAYGTAAAGFVRQYCLDHGVLIGVGGNFGSVLRIQPPLVIDDSHIEEFMEKLSAATASYAVEAQPA